MRIARKAVFFVASVVLGTVVSSEAAWVQGRMGSIAYGLFLPKNYSTSTKYPVVIKLHGAGQRGLTLINLQDQDATILTSDTSQAKYPCIVYAPQCPENAQWVNTPWGNGTYSTATVAESHPIKEALEFLEDSLIVKYSVDTNRIYLTGGSMGGYGVWDVLCRHPQRFAAAVPIAGAGDTSKASVFASTVPVWIFHGTNDEIVPVSGSRQMKDAIIKAGVTPKYNEYIFQQLNRNGFQIYGNHIWMLPIPIEPQLMPWLFSQSKASTALHRSTKVAGGIRAPKAVSLRIASSKNRVEIKVTSAHSNRTFDIRGQVR